MIKSLLIRGAILCGASVLLVLGVLLIFPPGEEANVIMEEAIDKSKPIIINMKDRNLYLKPWDKDEIQVCESIAHQKVQDGEVKLKFYENTLSVLSGKNIWHSQSYFFRSQVWYHMQYFDVKRYGSRQYDYYINLPWDTHVIMEDDNGYRSNYGITIEERNQP